MLDITIRSPVAADRLIIIDSWQKCFLGESRDHPRGTGPLSQVRRADYFSGQERLIDAILRHPGTRVMVASPPYTPDAVWGWVCGCPAARLLHFVYVSSTWRRERIGTRLMGACFATDTFPGAPITLTHWTRLFPCYREKWRLEYNPYPLFEVTSG